MMPTYKPGQLVLATGQLPVREGSVVVFWHNGLEKIKRVRDVNGDTLFVVGDNPGESTDSRQFGPIHATEVIAVVITARKRGHHE